MLAHPPFVAEFIIRIKMTTMEVGSEIPLLAYQQFLIHPHGRCEIPGKRSISTDTSRTHHRSL
ncbi:hypothetical protein [Streptomyces zhihengii]